MTCVAIEHDYPVLGPPDDLVTRLDPFPWHHFTTGEADAWCRVPDDYPHRFILHSIVSHAKGHGGMLLDEIGRWADTNRLTGGLICERMLVVWYESFGWEPTGPWANMIQMVRWPILSGRPMVDVWSELLS